MYRIKSFVAVIATLTIAVLTLSCDREPRFDYSLITNVQSQDFSKIDVTFTAGEDVAQIRYGYGSALTATQDSIKFERGTLSTINSIYASDQGFSITPQAGESVVIFIRTISNEGEFGETVTLKAVASPIAYEVSKVSLGSFVYTIPQNIGSYAGLSILTMAASTPDEWGMSAYDIVDMYAMYGMLEAITPGNSSIVELNGEPEVEQIMGIVYWNEDYTYDIKLVNFTSGKVIEGAEAASIEVKVNNVTAESAEFAFAPSESTCGYFYHLYKKADYDKTRSEATGMGLNPDDYLRDMAAIGGSFDYKTMTEKREYLASGTNYVLTCYPYNVNGTQGWGKSAIVEFSTK